jgi:hypothetical protein
MNRRNAVITAASVVGLVLVPGLIMADFGSGVFGGNYTPNSADALPGDVVSGIRSTQSINLPSINNDSTLTQTFTVTGAELGDPVLVNANCALEASINVDQRRVSATDTVSIRWRNHDQTNPVDPASCSYTIEVLKQ